VRILHVTAPAPVGGLERVVLGLTTGLRRAGHDARAFVVLDAGQAGHHPVEAALRDAGVPLTVVETSAHGYGVERRALSDACARFSPDVVHTHGGRPDVVDGGVARRLKIPWVSTVHGFTGGGGLKGRFYEWLQMRSYRRADGVIGVSEAIRDRLRRRGVAAGRIHHVPNAWASAGEAPLARIAARDALGVPRGGVRIGWVGRVSREKGPDVMVEALARLARPQVQLSLVGDGPLVEFVRARAVALGVDGAVTFHGLVPDAQRVLPAFDVLVLSSRTEGTPIILFEAVAASVPIVATAVGGVPAVVTDREAVLVPSDDPAALAQGIARALDDRAGALARATAATERVAFKFAAGPWIDRHVELYRTLKEGRRL